MSLGRVFCEVLWGGVALAMVVAGALAFFILIAALLDKL